MAQKPSDPSLSGQLVGGRYLLMKPIGRGGMGTVYRAIDQEKSGEKSHVAVKVLSRERADNRRHGDRFQREIEALSLVEHQNTVAIHSCGETDEGHLWFSMELVRGKTLSRVVDAPMDVPFITSVIRQILGALQAIHDKGLVHRDLKPANIMVETLDGAPKVKVLDFGVVRFIDPDRSVLTAQNTLLGTPAFIAPELVKGEPVDARSDLYAVGVCLHYLATGKYPFHADNANAILRMHVKEPPPPVQALRPEPLPERLEKLRIALLQKKPDDRPQTASEALDILEGRAEAPEPTPAASGPSWVKIGLGGAAGIALGLTIIAALLTYLLWS
ncbi:MAG: serine/threonine protein kinase [Deltaproteobacteria bacterium]|nr:MAG: serine/threonine protein kinase [Deltaproteobacteria bacterium]